MQPHIVRLVVSLALVAMVLPGTAGSAAASRSRHVTFETSKPFGPVPGTFSAEGAFSDAGTIGLLDRTTSAIGAPDFLVSHLTILFSGASGAITIRTQIVETFTVDPLVLTQDGSWTIVAGTGAYASLRGWGQVSGVADEHANAITRTFDGTVHVD